MPIQNIDRIDRDFLTTLTNEECDACISIYMPMVMAGPQTRQNAILFKDLIKRTEYKLEKYGIDKNRIAELLEPLEALYNDRPFWESRSEALAVFISGDKQIIYRSPEELPAAAIVDKHFYIRPLLPLLERNQNIDIALLGRDEAQLVNISGYECSRTTPPEGLESLQAFLAHHDFEESLQHASSTEAPHMHGQGTAGDEATANRYLEEYYKAFRNWLCDHLETNQTLYLAGDDQDIGLFMKVAGEIPFTITPLIRKNIQSLDEEALIREAGKAMAQHAEDEKNQEFEIFLQTKSNAPDQTLDDAPDQIIAAAYAKQIKTLFLPPEHERIWGHFNPANQNITLEQKPEDGGVGEELLNLAAIKTLQSGGKVLVKDAKPAAICHW